MVQTTPFQELNSIQLAYNVPLQFRRINFRIFGDLDDYWIAENYTSYF